MKIKNLSAIIVCLLLTITYRTEVTEQKKRVNKFITNKPNFPENVEGEYSSLSNKIEITWDEVKGVDGYYVYYSQDEEDGYICASNEGNPILFKTNGAIWKKDFTEGETYYIYVTAVKDDEESLKSENVSVEIIDRDEECVEYFPNVPDLPSIPGEEYETEYLADNQIVMYVYSDEVTGSVIDDYEELIGQYGWDYIKTTNIEKYTAHVYENNDEYVYITEINGIYAVIAAIS